MKKTSLIFSIFLISISAFSQKGMISGRILDSKSLSPIPFANVFINQTTIGTTTNSIGEFTLKNLTRPGIYDVVVSFVGYETYKLKVSLPTDELKLGDVRLRELEVELNAVEVKGTKDLKWERSLKKFKRIFLGEDHAAEQCIILNPWAIEFPKDEIGKKFKAVSNTPIQIENMALGYRLNFYLTNFEADHLSYKILGNIRFEELVSSDEKQRVAWSIGRNKSYMHSRQHLFKAMIANRINGEGFSLYTDMEGYENSATRSAFFKPEVGKTVKEYDTTKIISLTSEKDIYKISLKARVEVHYRKEKPAKRIYRDIFYPVSWINLSKDFILINKQGMELNPEDIIVSGNMNDDRVAHMLPTDYLPEEIIPNMIEPEQNTFTSLYEKIYIHTDRPYYYPGESLWFKGYINYSEPLLRDSLSRTVYAELINDEKTIVASKTLKIDNGFFSNNFDLPSDLSSGKYYLRAYTNLNRNFGDDILYVKEIAILAITETVNNNTQPISTLTNQDSSLVISTDKSIYKTKEKINITVKVNDDAGERLASNLSIAVTDITRTILSEDSNNILNSFPIKEIRTVTNSLAFPIEYGVSFSGRFLNEENAPSKATINVFQLHPRNFTMTQSDENGIFSVSGLTFYDSSSFSIQSLNKNGKLSGHGELIKKETPAITLPEKNIRLDIRKTGVPRVVSDMEFPKDARLLQAVEVQANRIPEEIDRMKRPYGKPDYVLTGKQINTAYGNLLLTLPGKIPGLIVRQTSNPGEETRWVVYNVRGAMSSLGNGKEVLVTVNDVIVGGRPADILGAINPEDVVSIEMKNGINVLYGGLSGFGVLSIYTKKDEPLEDNVKSSKNISVMKVKGYSLQQKFSSPNYDDPAFENVTDNRSLIYWNPEIITDDKTGIAMMSFFASGVPSRYRVYIEGVTKNGKPLHAEYFIEVEGR